MSIQVVNWVNARGQSVPVKFDTSEGFTQKTVQKKVNVMQTAYKNANFDNIEGMGVFRNGADKNRIEGILGIKNAPSKIFTTGTKEEGPGVAQVLMAIGKHLSPAFAGSKPVAKIEPQAKQPLSLLA